MKNKRETKGCGQLDYPQLVHKVMHWKKKYRWTRTWGAETGIDGKPHQDFVGWDGETNIGRIYLDQQTMKAGRYYWAIQYPRGSKPYQPNFGWELTAAEAAKLVEDLWDVMLLKLEQESVAVPQHVEQYKGYRVAIYSPLAHYAVITRPGSNSVMDFRDRRPTATAAEGYEVCLERAKSLIDELTMEVGD